MKCKAKDCKRKIETPYIYCSITCACYDGNFDVKKGWKKMKPRPKKELIKKLKPYWISQEAAFDLYIQRVANIEDEMRKELKMPKLEFFWCDGAIVGIGNEDRTLKLIHDSELR